MNMRKIIILEDEQFIRKSIVMKFKKLTDYQIVLETDNGKEVIQFIEKQSTDLLITDINMPILNGFSVIEKAKEFNPHLKVVIISGYDKFNYLQRGVRLGINDYLLKPIKDEDILQLVQRLDKHHEYEQSVSIANQVDLFILKYYLNEITVESLAENLGYSKEYLSRKYKETYSISIYQKIMNLRIEKAKKLLIESPYMEIQDVGEHVGYEDRYHFSKVFKQKTNFTPSDYRNHILKGNI